MTNVIKTSIVADVVTHNDVIFRKEVLETAIEDFNKSCKGNGPFVGVTDTKGHGAVALLDKATHTIYGVFLDEDNRLCFEVKFLHEDVKEVYERYTTNTISIGNVTDQHEVKNLQIQRLDFIDNMPT